MPQLPSIAPALALSALALATACSRSDRVVGQSTDLPTVDSVRLSQGGCFGTCPVFTLTVASDGYASYTGKAYSRFRGRHLGRVGADTLARILTRAAPILAAADTLRGEYPSMVSDLSRRTVTVYGPRDSVRVVSDIAFPPVVDSLLAALGPVAARGDWRPAPGTPPPPPSELVLTLAADGDIEAVRGEFFRQMLRVEEELPGETPTYRVSFDPYTMTAEEMIRDLGSRGDVLAVRMTGVGGDAED